MHDLAFLGMDIIFLPLWLLIFLKRDDLRPRILKIGAVAGFLSIIAEYFWYYKDYWHPPFFLGINAISIDDYLFGFFITGIGVTLFDFVFREKGVKENKTRGKEVLMLFLLGLGILIVFTSLLGFNSVVVSSFSLLVCLAIMLFIRKDLLTSAIFSGVLIVILMIFMYVILFTFIFHDFWNKYWLLAGSKLDHRIIGIPITEFLWYFSMGSLMGTVYEFFKGFKKVKLS